MRAQLVPTGVCQESRPVFAPLAATHEDEALISQILVMVPGLEVVLQSRFCGLGSRSMVGVAPSDGAR